MKIKTAEATPRQIDWLVAQCEGHDVVVLTVDEQQARWLLDVPPEKLAKEQSDFETYIRPTCRPIICIRGDDGYKRRPTHVEAPMLWGKGIPAFEYSESWSQGGPIIEREIGNLWKHNKLDPSEPDVWTAAAYRKAPDGTMLYYEEGPTPLIAAMRCYVASRLGDEVEIPKELA